MVLSARLVVCALCAALLCALAAAPASAQQPFNAPKLRDTPKGGFGAKATATPTATASATATPAPTARPRRVRSDLPNTGADPLRLALAGLTMLGFGFALRFRVALADARLDL